MDTFECSNEDIFNLLCFMAASAEGCVDEPKLYGPLRLVEAMERLIKIMEEEDAAGTFLLDEKKKIEENKKLTTSGEEEFVNFLEELVSDFAEKLKNY